MIIPDVEVQSPRLALAQIEPTVLTGVASVVEADSVAVAVAHTAMVLKEV